MTLFLSCRTRRALGGVFIASALVLATTPQTARALNFLPGANTVTGYVPIVPQVTGVVGGPLVVAFQAFGLSVEVDLLPANLVADGTRSKRYTGGVAEEYDIPNIFYQGSVVGDANSSAAITVLAGGLSGFVRTADDVIVLTPLARLTGLALPGTVAFRASDLITELPADSCGVTGHAAELLNPAAPRGLAPSERQRGARGAASSFFMDVALVADRTLFQRHGEDTDLRMLDRLNQVSVIFQQRYSVALQASVVDVYASAPEPFSSSNDPYLLLSELADYRRDEGGAVTASGLAHLFTGREFSSNAVGIGYLDVLCEAHYGVSLDAEFTSNDYLLTLVTAHEIGHNFSAPHDGESGSPCSSENRGFLMWPSVGRQTDQDFSLCSAQRIAGAAENADCVRAPALGCGDGILDAGEQCDDGNNVGGDCCAPDCLFGAFGSTCAGDANTCTDDVCDGAGRCTQSFNTASCDDADACTGNGICQAGDCEASTLPTPLSRTTVKAVTRDGDQNDKLSLSTVVPANGFATSPDEGGVAIEITDATGSTVYQSFIGPAVWVAKKANKFTYRAGRNGTPETSGIDKAKVSYDRQRDTLKVKAKAKGFEIPGLGGSGARMLKVQIGEADNGSCGLSVGATCVAKGSTVICEQ